MEIYRYARAFMAAHGNPRQWGATNWPPERLIRRDVAQGNSYVCVHGDRVVGTFFFAVGEDVEPTYREIRDGRWRDPGPYGVIHRMAFGAEFQGRGLFPPALRLVEAACLARGVRSLRIDTDPSNLRMQHLLERNGFTLRGTVLFQGDAKLAYDKVLEPLPGEA